MNDRDCRGWRLRFVGDGAVLLQQEAPADAVYRPTPAGGEWVAPGGEALHRISRDEDAATITLTGAPADNGAGATASSPEPLGETGGVYYLLVADGRLFRLAPRGMRPGGFELTGWDTPGPYLIARPDPVGWNLEVQPAGQDLEDLRTLMFLVATRIIEDDRTGGNEQR